MTKLNKGKKYILFIVETAILVYSMVIILQLISNAIELIALIPYFIATVILFLYIQTFVFEEEVSKHQMFRCCLLFGFTIIQFSIVQVLMITNSLFVTPDPINFILGPNVSISLIVTKLTYSANELHTVVTLFKNVFVFIGLFLIPMCVVIFDYIHLRFHKKVDITSKVPEVTI